MRMVRRVKGFSELSLSSLCSVFRVQKVSLQCIYAVRIKIRTAVFLIRHLSFAALYFPELIGRIYLLKYKTNSPSSISANKNFVNPKCK